MVAPAKEHIFVIRLKRERTRGEKKRKTNSAKEQNEKETIERKSVRFELFTDNENDKDRLDGFFAGSWVDEVFFFVDRDKFGLSVLAVRNTENHTREEGLAGGGDHTRNNIVKFGVGDIALDLDIVAETAA
jgi:hypothetical protein